MNSQRGLSGTLRRTNKHRQPEHRADPERQPPADVLGEDRRVQQQQCTRRAARRTQPVRAVDDEVDPSAHARRDEFVDRGVDRGVLAADAGTGEEPGDEEVPRRERECRCHRCGQVHHRA